MSIMLPFPDKLDRSTVKTVKFHEVSAKFGEGQKQSAPRGLNPVSQNWNILWQALTLSEKNSLETILDGAGSWTAILWTPCYDTVEKTFYLDATKGYKTKHIDGNRIFNVSCTLIEDFDLVV